MKIIKGMFGIALCIACAIILASVVSCSKKEAAPEPQQEEGEPAAGASAASAGSMASMLPEISGWTADEPQEMRMKIMGSEMHNITRDYDQGNKGVTVILSLGGKGMTDNPSLNKMPDVDMSMGNVKVETIDGFYVQIVKDPSDNSSMVNVYLQGRGTGAGALTFSSEELTADELLSFAQKFDWKAMKSAIDK